MTKWTRQPQETDGEYFFDGEIYMTRGVAETIAVHEIAEIVFDLRKAVEREVGLDYLQVYTNEEGIRLWIIDQLSRTMVESGDYEEGSHHCAIMFPEEY